VDVVETVQPFQQEEAVEIVSRLLLMKGVRVIISQEECVLARLRRESRALYYTIDPETCTFCRACVRETGCPALEAVPAEGSDSTGTDKKRKGVMSIDPDGCTGCGLCVTCCKFNAIHPVEEAVCV
jgi:TPP-dependent indolepyruvate ferredoxin oxidoreductase alpha subunit